MPCAYDRTLMNAINCTHQINWELVFYLPFNPYPWRSYKIVNKPINHYGVCVCVCASKTFRLIPSFAMNHEMFSLTPTRLYLHGRFCCTHGKCSFSTPIAVFFRLPLLSRLYTKYTHKMCTVERMCVCIVFVNVDNKCRRYKNPYYLRSHNFHNQNHCQLIQPLVSHRMYNNIHFPICTLHESHSRLLFLSSFHSRSSTRWEWVCACTCLFHPFVYLHFDYHTNTQTRTHLSEWSQTFDLEF